MTVTVTGMQLFDTRDGRALATGPFANGDYVIERGETLFGRFAMTVDSKDDGARLGEVSAILWETTHDIARKGNCSSWHIAPDCQGSARAVVETRLGCPLEFVGVRLVLREENAPVGGFEIRPGPPSIWAGLRDFFSWPGLR